MRLSGLSRFFARSFLGAGIFGQASWEAAVANLQKAVELDPERIYHRLELARIYADRKRFQEAQDQLGRIQSLPDRELLDPLYRERAAALARRIADRT
jgi:Tfp pilus assembly protein PilF